LGRSPGSLSRKGKDRKYGVLVADLCIWALATATVPASVTDNELRRELSNQHVKPEPSGRTRGYGKSALALQSTVAAVPDARQT
jgi:hypothetical protein